MPEVIFTGPEGRLEGRYQPSEDKNAPIAIILHPHPHPSFGGTMNHPIAYKLFSPAGLPLRATLSATFREHTPKGFGELLKNLASPDIDHAHQVLEGEHLTRIVHSVYKEPAYYMAVAAAIGDG